DEACFLFGAIANDVAVIILFGPGIDGEGVLLVVHVKYREHPLTPPLPIRPYFLTKCCRQVETVIIAQPIAVAFRDNIRVVVAEFIFTLRKRDGTSCGIRECSAERPPLTVLIRCRDV